MEQGGMVEALDSELRQVEERLKVLVREQAEVNAAVEKEQSLRDALLFVRRHYSSESMDEGLAQIGEIASGRLTIEQRAVHFAKANEGRVKVGEFVKLLNGIGFKSDHGGVHTILAKSVLFVKSAPGEFRLIDS